MFKKLQILIADTLNVSERSITRDTSIVDDLGADSLALVELLMALEEEFDVAIPDEDALRLETADDILRYLEAEGVAE
ncbi:MAG: acyl carrier protein [Clostridiales bacterium]|nr:acyl carrier protein [Clostridiales bacterium]